MKRFVIVTASIFSLILKVNFAYAQIPLNLTCAKQAVIQYYNSGEYVNNVNTQIKSAELYLQKVIDNNGMNKKKLAITLDIDDTSLSNFFGNKKRDFSGLPELIEQSYHDTTTPAIAPVLRLYNEAIKNGVAMFFISFRPDTVKNETVQTLQNAGYYGWSQLYLPNVEELKSPPEIYKTAIRKMLTESGYTIVLNIGDQDSDLVGGYAERTVKIPNPLYTISKHCEVKGCTR